MNIRNRFGWLAASVIIALAGCATAPEIPEDAQMMNGAPVVVEDLDGGVKVVAIDAQSEEDWVYFDLDEAQIVEVSDPFEESTWDLGFQRFRVKTNGGVSGDGGAAIASLETDEFAQTASIDSAEWRADSGSGNRITYAFTANGNWYRYQFRTHTLESLRKVLAVRSTDGVVYRLQMLTYYDRFYLAGYPTFRYVSQ